MAARKRRALERIGSLAEHHRVAELDALRDRRPAQPGRARRASSTPARGWRSSPRGCSATWPPTPCWRCGGGSRATLQGSPPGATSPTCISAASRRRRSAASGIVLAAFVRGRVYLHFDDAAEAEAALRDGGLRRRRGAPGGPDRSSSCPNASSARRRIYLRHQPSDSEASPDDHATLYTDPACPWAYSESPALRVIEWRYGDQLDWRLVLDRPHRGRRPVRGRGATRPLRGALGQLHVPPRYGMPFAPAPKARVSATARACRAVVAARLANPGTRVGGVPRPPAGQLHHPAGARGRRQLRDVLRGRSRASTPRRSSPRSTRPRSPRPTRATRPRPARPPASAAELQGKTATTDGPVRFTAPSVVFQSNGTSLVAGGFQPVEAYDVLIANLDPTLTAQRAARDARAAAGRLPGGLTTQEVAALMTHGNDAPDRAAAEAALHRARGRRARRRASRWATTRCGAPPRERRRPASSAQVSRSGSDSRP